MMEPHSKPGGFDRGRGVLLVLVVFVITGAGRHGAGSVAPRQAAAVAAIVSAMRGDATISSEGKPRPVQLLDEVKAGAVISVAATSRVSLLLTQGRHFVLENGARATVFSKGLEETEGAVVELETLAALPASATKPLTRTGRPGAMLLRSDDAPAIDYPWEGVSTLPASTVLRFVGKYRSSPYTVRVFDADGELVFETNASPGAVDVPANELGPGATFYWEVIDPVSARRVESTFRTLELSTLTDRERFIASLATTTEPMRTLLLAELDRRLGLLAEALSRVTVALERFENDAGLIRLKRELDEQLSAPDSR